MCGSPGWQQSAGSKHPQAVLASRRMPQRPRARVARLVPLVIWCALALAPDPCRGWWGKERTSAAGPVAIDGAKAKAVEAWRVANETNATAQESLLKAAALDATARDAKTAADKAQKGGVFSKKATQEEVEALEFAAKEAKMLAATARQTADALVGAARQARKRADKADAVVRAAQQTIQISDKLAAANTQLAEANTLLEVAVARHAEAEALVTTAAEEVERERKATDAAQQALESVQTQVSTQGKDAPEELYAQQKEMSARARQQQEAFAEAVKRLTEAQKTESLLAVEVATLKTRVVEAQHALTAVELELKQTQELEQEFEAEVAQSYLEAKLTQILSEKSALEQQVLNMTYDLIGLNKSHASERSLLESKVANMTADIQVLNETLTSTVQNFSRTLKEFAETNHSANYSGVPSMRVNELETEMVSLNNTCVSHERDKIVLAEKAEREKQLLADKLYAESRANETKRIEEFNQLNQSKVEEIQKLIRSFSAEKESLTTEKETLLNISKAVNRTLKELRERNLNESLQQEMAGLWKTANDTADAASKAKLDAQSAVEVASDAEKSANAAQPFFLFRWFVSTETLHRAQELLEKANDLRKKAMAASGTAKALERLHSDHERIVTNLTEELDIALGRVEILQARANKYESFLPPVWIDPRRMVRNFSSNAYYFLLHTWRTSFFLVLFLGMTGVYLSQLIKSTGFGLRFLEYFGIDFHILYGLYVAFWLGNAEWSWGWMIFCVSLFVSTVGHKRSKRIKAASRMAYRLPIREFDDRVDPGFDLEINVISGILDKTSDTLGKGDPYVVVQCGDETQKTESKRNTLTPKWDKRMEFMDLQESGVEIIFTVYDYDMVGKDEVIGSFSVRLYDILSTTREGQSSEPMQYSIRTTDMGMTKGTICVAWKWRVRSSIDFKNVIKKSNARRTEPKFMSILDGKSRKRYRFDPYWGEGREAEDLCAFLDKHAPGVTATVAGIYKQLLAYNINPNGIHISLFSFIAFLLGRFGRDVGYVIPLAMGLYKTESVLSAVLCRAAWEKHPNKCNDVRTKALHLWQQAFIPEKDHLNPSQLWGMFQSIREDFPYWLREHETAWLNNLLGMFWTNYNKWISSYVANLVQSLVPAIDVEEVQAGSGYPKLVNSLGCIAHPKDFPKVKDKLFVTVLSASGLVAKQKASEALKGDFSASCDPYVKISLHSWTPEEANKMSKKTKTKENCINPYWDEEFMLELPKDGEGTMVHLEILDDDIGTDEQLAFVDIATAEIQGKLASVDEFEHEYSVSTKSKSKTIKLRLKWRMEIGIPFTPLPDSKRMFQLDSDVVWDTNLTVAIRVMGVQVQVKVLSIRLPLRVTLEWLDYDVQMRKCPIMSTCGNDFEEFRRQWQEWADSGHWPMPTRIWLDCRAHPSLKTEVNAGMVDVWSLPGLSALEAGGIGKIIYNLFPMQICCLSDPAPVSQHKKPSFASTQFADFLDSSKNGGISRQAILKLHVSRATVDQTLPLEDSNYYCVVRYGRMLKLEPPLDKELLLNENQEQLRFSSTQWATRYPKFSDEMAIEIEAPEKDMIAFEMYQIQPKHRNRPQGRKIDTLVLKHKMKFTEFIDKYGVIVYPRISDDSNKRSLRRTIRVKDFANPGLAELTLVAQLVTAETGSELFTPRPDRPEDVRGSYLEETHLGLIADDGGGHGCPGTLLVQLSAPSHQTEEQKKRTHVSRDLNIALYADGQVVDRAVFHESADDALTVTRSTMGPIFHFEVPTACCKYQLEISTKQQKVTMPLRKMKLEYDGFYEWLPEDFKTHGTWDPQGYRAPESETLFPAIVASFLPHIQDDMPTIMLTIHNAYALPWTDGPAPLESYCRVSVKKDRRPPKDNQPSTAEQTRQETSQPSMVLPGSTIPQTYEQFLKARHSKLPVYDGGEKQEKQGYVTSRSEAQTEWYFGDKFSLVFEKEMLRSNHDFHQVLFIEVLQANEIGPPTLVGTWEKPARQLYLEFLESPKVSKIPDEEMAKMSSIVGTTGSMGISLTREQSPWTSIEVEIEYQGNWMHCTEAYSKWWDKQEQAARIERGKLEAEAAAKMWEEQAKEALDWQKILKERKEKEELEQT